MDEGSLLFLHGFGDSGKGWAGQLPKILQAPELRYVLPTAKSDGGLGRMGITTWFDIGSMLSGGVSASSSTTEVDNRAMQESIDYCHFLIREELRRGIPPGRILVGGFSQGGCLAVRAALSFPEGPLGGCLAVSTFLGSADRLPIAEANARLRVLVCHGESDNVVPLKQGQRLSEALRARGLRVEFKSYPGVSHAYCEEEAADVRRFARLRLAAHGGETWLQGMSARELKALLADLGVPTAGCFEKGDLVERARSSVL